MNELFESIFTFEEKNLVIFIELVTAVTSLIYFYKYNNTYLKYLPFFLWYILINEILGRYMSVVAEVFNHKIYNVYLLVSMTFLLSIYFNFLKSKNFKKYVKYFIIIYIILFTINGCFIENYNVDLVTYPFIISSCFLIISVVFYFVEILNSEKLLNVTRNLLFWISVGVVLFNIGIIPWSITLKYLSEDFYAMNILFKTLIFILNICYIIGFIWSHKMEE